MKKNIRKATEKDIPRLKEIRSAVKENPLLDPSRVTDEDYQWFIENGPLWIWEEDRILGLSAGDPRDGSIWALFVDPGFENKGIGGELFKCCCESLKSAGHKVLTLSTARGTRAERFYKAKGWVEDGEKENNQVILKIMNG